MWRVFLRSFWSMQLWQPPSGNKAFKLTAKIFDPIGFLTPFTIEILFQELCLERIDWDGKLQGNLLKLWKTLLEELKCFAAVLEFPVAIQIQWKLSFMGLGRLLIARTLWLFIRSVQNADCRLQTADQVQNADWQEKLFLNWPRPHHITIKLWQQVILHHAVLMFTETHLR